MYTSMSNEDFGECADDLEEYRLICHKRFPYASQFQDPATINDTSNCEIGSDDNAKINESIH